MRPVVARFTRVAPTCGCAHGVGTCVDSPALNDVAPLGRRRSASMLFLVSLLETEFADRAMDIDFKAAYRNLDQRMKALAESDGDVYLPNPEPAGTVDYVFICMEPSLGGWARSAEEARARVASGFRNFLAGIDPMLLHFSARRYLCNTGQRYHITDFSKGAMLVKHAGQTRTDRYGKWYALLREEIDLIAAPGARVIAVGNVVAEHLRRYGFDRTVTQVIHYSPLASSARAACIQGHEEQFREFARSISTQDMLASVREVLDESKVPPTIYSEALSIVERSRLLESQRKLIYCYKLAFEAMKIRQGGESDSGWS